MRTTCEHPQWLTTAGRYKLEARGLIKLPPKRPSPAGRRPMVVSSATDPGETIVGSVRDIEPVAVEPVRNKETVAFWNEYVRRYHPQGDKRPFGTHQRYFIRGAGGRLLGCLLFAHSAWALAERDAWIGWTQRDRPRRLNWVLANTRFLIFPWVQVRNPASKALSLAAARIPEDWHQRYGYRPVLLETFVDAERYAGTRYRAAN